ncbi:MAG: hypothetical protein QOG62_2689 [Thermoleophilaceae bacterium]|nr:hypothetical protein [Thermoleophilaceae bacterium]
MSCGTGIEGSAPRPEAEPQAQPDPPELPKERRQVTVLFADLSGYTSVAERMDPEALQALVDRILRRLAQVVQGFGGTVDKYIGDNVMALFGAPVAHEDDAERAVRAALEMQDAMEAINRDLGEQYGARFGLRVGINTGEVMTGTVGDRYTVTGDAVNVASRLQDAGRPDHVIVGQRTQRLTRHVIDYAEAVRLELKGKSAPVAAWEVVGVRTGSELLPALGLSPLVGRDSEVNLLGSIFARVLEERTTHLVTVVGQAGVGKTRLLDEFKREVEAGEQALVREGRCLPYGSSLAYWALGEVIRADAGIVDSDTSGVAWEKLRAHVAESGGEEDPGALARRAAMVARLIGIDAPEEFNAPAATDPERVREALFSAVRSTIESRVSQTPLVLVFEDIHWADDGMLDLIEYLAQWVRGPLLLMGLTRDDLLERRPSWGGGVRAATSIPLEPLSRIQTEELVAGLMPDVPDAVAMVADRAGGNPLFAQEMARRLAEDGGGPGDLPDTVQGLLAARIDSLDSGERLLVQQAAVVGRTFWASSLAAVAAEERCDLDGALRSLEEKGIVEPSAGGKLAGEQEYAFKHVLFRDVAYSMLPKAVRATKHFDVGRFIEERAGDRSDEVVALLAEHYGRAAGLGTETGIARERLDPMHRKALQFLDAAGDAAASFYSNQEAFAHYRAAREQTRVADQEVLVRIAEKQADVGLRIGRVDAALELWGECLDYHRSHENLERVGDLHRKIGAGLWHKGEGRQAIEHYQKGINLLKDGPPRLELVRLYEEAAWLYMHTGDNMLAIYAAEKALRLAERLGETKAACRAHGIFGRVFGRIGDTVKARENLERSVELAREADEAETIRALLTLGDHLEISDADYLGAREAYEEALGIAQRVGDLPAQLELHAALATLATYRADWHEVNRYLEISGRLAEGEGLSGKLALPAALRGLMHWRDGDWDSAAEHFRHSQELASQVGWSEVTFQALFGLATTLRDRGDYSGAVDALKQALDVCERSGLIAQSIQAISHRAIVLTLAGQPEQAREAAEEAADLAERLHYPIGKASALEAAGFTAVSQEDGADLLREARGNWVALGRPLEAARCDLLSGRVLMDYDPDAARQLLESAAAQYEELGVGPLAARARELSAA